MAEWFTFGASCAVLAVVLALIVLQFPDSTAPAAPVAVTEGVRSADGQSYVDVLVTNEGDETAASVQVSASLEIDGETTEGDQTIDFLAANEDVRLTFVFDDDPELGVLTIVVTGFTNP